MADSTLSALTASGALAGTELFYSDSGAADVKVTATQIKTFAQGGVALLASANIFTTNGAVSAPPISLNGTWYSGGSATTTKPQFLIEPSGTTSIAWSTSGTGLGVNAPSGFVGNIADFQINGTSLFKVGPTVMGVAQGVVITNRLIGSIVGGIAGIGVMDAVTGGNWIGFLGGSGPTGGGGGLSIRSGDYIQWSNSANDTLASTADTFIKRGAAASIQFGFADAASAVAQTLRVQSVVAGTSNIAGAAWTVRGSLSTGSGLSGDIVFKTGDTGAAATAQNAAVTALTIKGGTAAGLSGSVLVGSAAIATTATDGFLYIPTCAGTPTGTPTAVTGLIPMIYDTTNDQFWFYRAGWKQPKTPAGAAVVTWQ